MSGISKIAQQDVSSIIQASEKFIPVKGSAKESSPGGPCVPGMIRLFVAANGDLFPCERVSETSVAMKIGTIYDGIDFNKAKALLNVGSLTEKECKKCWAFDRCILCEKYADDNTILSGEKKLNYCLGSKRRAEKELYSFLLINEIKELYR